MKNIDYRHNVPPSFKAKLIVSAMGLIGIKKRMEQKMISNDFEKKPAEPPRSLRGNFDVREKKQNGRKVWTIAPKEGKSHVIIVYLHGGAYMANITKQHWNLIEKLIHKKNSTMVVPDYPLAPEASCKETYEFIGRLYAKLIAEHPKKSIILMGDSAGGGLALGFAQQLRNENKKQPHQLILFSPWLDVTMSDPDLPLLDKEDKILSIRGLRDAGQKYAGDLDLKDHRVSPIYGSLNGLCRISIFTGTKDILNADAKRCKKLMRDLQADLDYFEYPDMFHDWVIFTGLKESVHGINRANRLIG